MNSGSAPVACHDATSRPKEVGRVYRVGHHPVKVAVNQYLADVSVSLLQGTGGSGAAVQAPGRCALVLDTPLLLSASALHAAGFRFEDIWVPNPNAEDFDAITRSRGHGACVCSECGNGCVG